MDNHGCEDCRDLKRVAVDLFEELRDRYAQTRCGCRHPACKRCQDDQETERVLWFARQKMAGKKC